MAGTYIEGSSQPLSGVYTLIQSVISGIPLGDRGKVAYPFTADWGPVNSLETVLYASEFNKKYHAENENLTANLIHDLAFKGKPQRVFCYRMTDGSESTATLTLQDDGTADSITLETLYPTERDFKITVKDNVTADGKLVQLIEDGIKLGEWEGTTVDELVDKINGSDYLTATAVGSTLPANISGQSMIGGNNGASNITSTQYSAFLDAVEANGQAQAFSLDGVSDAAINTTAEDWTKQVRDRGLYITFVAGGPASWDNDIDSANTQSKSYNHRGIINVGNGADGYTAAEMAIFVAARVASIPLNRTVTDVVTDFDKVNKDLLPGDRVKAKEAGTLVFVHDSDGMVVIDEGVNTLTAPSGGEHKYMGKIRVNNALDAISRDLEAFGNEYKKTRSNTQEARQTYAALVEDTYFAAMAALDVIKDEPGFGYFYEEDSEYHGKDAVFSPALDEAYFHAQFTPVDSMERIYQKFQLKF